MGLKEIYMPSVALGLARAGFASLAFDYRGFGESEGPRYRLIPSEQIEDIQNALSYVETRDDVRADMLMLWGTSLGGSHALTVAATDSRVRCVVANTPAANLARQVQRRPSDELSQFWRDIANDRRERALTGRSKVVSPLFILPYDDDSQRAYQESLAKYPERRKMLFPLETVDRFLGYMPERFVDLISPRPLLLISAEFDMLTPPNEQRALFERALAPKRLEIINGATHYTAYTSPFFDQIIGLSVAFYEDSIT